jgi:hypothetical protein
MKFSIVRASAYLDEDKQPTPSATKEGDEWVVEISTLEELLALQAAEGDLILTGRDIWIYDDYME